MAEFGHVAEFGHALGPLEPWLHQYGVAAVFLILTLESFGMPLPGESLLIVAAILAGRGDISFPSLLVSAWAGAVIGDNIGYLVGRMLGHKLVWRYGAKVGLNAERLRRIEALFAQYGTMTVGFARFFNVLRQLNGVVAGTLKMEWRQFLTFNALGGALWVLVWTTAGLFLGRHGADIAAILRKLGFLGVIFALIALIVIVVYIYGNRLFTRSQGDIAGKPATTELPASVQDQLSVRRHSRRGIDVGTSQASETCEKHRQDSG